MLRHFPVKRPIGRQIGRHVIVVLRYERRNAAWRPRFCLCAQVCQFLNAVFSNNKVLLHCQFEQRTGFKPYNCTVYCHATYTQQTEQARHK